MKKESNRVRGPEKRGGQQVRTQERSRAAAEQPRREAADNTSWDEVSVWYDRYVGDKGSEYHREVILPGVDRLLGHITPEGAPLNIVDLACGQGILCRHLAQQGKLVTGIDLSEDLLAQARRRSEGVNGVDYICADATRLLTETGQPIAPLRENSFDAATLVLAVQNMTSLSSLWRGAAALLKPQGALIVVMMHPCFRIPQRSDWYWNEREHRQQRTAWRYLTSEEIAIEAHPGRKASGGESASTRHFHRPLQAYINTLGNAGLWVDHIEEWSSHKREQRGVKSEALDMARREFPLFLALRARKAVRS